MGQIRRGKEDLMAQDEARIALDFEIPVPEFDKAVNVKHVIEHAIKRKLEEIPTDVYRKLTDECNIIQFRTVRKKGGP